MMHALSISNRDAKTSRVRCTHRRGVTLLELLIVITILGLVTATTIPLMLSGVDQRKAKEAARLVSGYFATAKARAAETGKTSGVMILRFPGGIVANGTSIQLSMVECPAVYAGDAENSVVTVAGGIVTFNPSGSPAVDNYATNVHVGDIIRFGYQGRTYFLTGNGSQTAGQPLTGNTSNLMATDYSGIVAPPMPNGVSFQVTRQPTKSAVPPLQLPEGVAIDLVQSGGGMGSPPLSPPTTAPLAGYIPLDGNPIILTFSPSGTTDLIFYNGTSQGHPISPLCLLIGKPDQVAATPGFDTNLFDGTSLWVAVTPQGRVITAENAINNAATTTAGARAFIYGYGTGSGGTGGITTSAGGG
jgi:prepilin-type N-terminal cleavage/methylation domain-containing protein